MGAAAAIGGGLSILGGILGAGGKQQQASGSIAGLELEKREVGLSEQARSIKRLDDLNTIIGTNLTVAAARGVAPSSGSFKAVSQASFGDFNEDEKMDQLNTALKEQFIEQKEENLQDQANAQGISGILGSVGSVISGLL